MAVERVDYTERVLRRGHGADPVCNRPVNIDGGEGSEQTQGAPRGYRTTWVCMQDLETKQRPS